jgi:hypothetical protein
MIETLLDANGFDEAYGFLDQPHIHTELSEIADRARRAARRRGEDGPSSSEHADADASS